MQCMIGMWHIRRSSRYLVGWCLWERPLWRCTRRRDLVHALIHSWRPMRSAPRLFGWCPWSSRGLLDIRLWCEARTRLLVCIDLVPLSSRRVLSALCLQIGEGRRSCDASRGEAGFYTTTRRWNDGSLGRWRRASLRSHSGSRSCGAKAIDTLRFRDPEYRLILVRPCIYDWWLLLLLCSWRWEVLLVIFGIWVACDGVCTALCLHRQWEIYTHLPSSVSLDIRSLTGQ